MVQESAVREQIDGILQRVRTRVLLDSSLRASLFGLFAGLCLLVGLRAVDRAFFAGLETPALGTMILLAPVVFCVIRALLRGRLDLFASAVELDARLRLKERASSAVYLRSRLAAAVPETGESRELQAWEEILERDAHRSVSGLAVERCFPVRVPRWSAWSAVPLCLWLCMGLWLPQLDILGIRSRDQARNKLESAVREEQKKLDEKLVELEKEAEKKIALEARKLLEALRELPRLESPPERPPPAESGKEPKKEALVELARREEMLKKGLQGKPMDALKDAVQRLKELELKGAEVTSKLQESLKAGRFDEAAKALEEIKAEMSQLSRKSPGELSEKEKARLEQLAAELSRLSKDAKALSRLSKALSKASAGLDGLRPEEALEGLSDMAKELDSLAALDSDMQILEQALELVRLSREQIAGLKVCPECGTPYCPDCGKPQCGCRSGAKPGGT